MKKLLINTFLGAACLLSCVDASGMKKFSQTQGLQSNKLNPQQRQLIEACKKGTAEEVKNLIKESKIDIDTVYNIQFGATLLIVAIMSENIKIVEALLKLGANINVIAGENTPLIRAIRTRNIEIIKMLLNDSRIDVNIATTATFPLFEAVDTNDIEIVKLLLADPKIDVNQSIKWKTDLRKTGVSEDTALSCVIDHNKDPDILRLLLNHPNIEIDKRDVNGFTPFMKAVIASNLNAVQILLDSGKVDLTTKDKENMTVLHNAICGRRELYGDVGLGISATDIVRLLLQYPIDINAKDNAGGTALHYAVFEGAKDLVNLLISQERIDINAEDSDGLTPLHLACLARQKDIVELLIEKGAKVYASGGINPVLFVVKKFDETNLPKTLELIMQNVDRNQLPSRDEVQTMLDQREDLPDNLKQQVFNILYPKK